MNKILWVSLALFLVISNVRCGDDSDEVLEKVKSKHLKKILKDRKETLDDSLSKLEEHCPGVSTKLKEALKTFGECDDKVDESLTICAAIQSYTLNCTQPLIKVVDDCLPQKAKGLPSLGIKSVLSVSEYLCKLDGESIFELFNPCLYEDLDDSNEQQDQCEKDVLAKVEKYKDEPPSPSEICNIASSMRSCVETHTTQSCKNQKTRTVALGLYDAVVRPCSSINEV